VHRHYNVEEQKTIGRWFGLVVVFYSVLVLLLFAVVALRINFLDPQIDASAADPIDASECISRGRWLFASIEAHREARDVADDRLSDALSAVMKARAACNAGRLGEALAIYDSIKIALNNSRGNQAAPWRRFSSERDHDPFTDFR
jgi:hypothetical protein